MRIPPVRLLTLSAWLVCALFSPLNSTLLADINPNAGMMRYPDVGPTHIVFIYANELWLVPRAGGVAQPLASPLGIVSSPKFSADGQTIAFRGHYEGDNDLYTIPVTGGLPTRVTHHPTRETLNDWTSDGRLVFTCHGLSGIFRASRLFTVDATGGLPEPLPVPYGAAGAISDDGEWLAYTPHNRDDMAWKRYRGGWASDIWLLNLKRRSSRKITDWEGTDTQPMWFGDKLYYLSDAGDQHRLNIWMFDPRDESRDQITHYSGADIKWPSIGPGDKGEGEIVYQYGSSLTLLNLRTRQTRQVDVAIPGDRPLLRPRAVNVRRYIRSWGISSTGRRALIEARGDIWTTPADQGEPRNLTRTSGIAETQPAWSPDGKWIAYFSDASGEYELHIMQSDDGSETRQLTNTGRLAKSNISWSPDSRRIVFDDQSGAMHLLDVESGSIRSFDSDSVVPGDESYDRSFNWSPDSRWLAYGKLDGENSLGSIWIYDATDDALHRVTSSMFDDRNPVFDRRGDYLYFRSTRSAFSSVTSDLPNDYLSFAYKGGQVLMAVPLRTDMDFVWTPKSDEETWGEDESEGDEVDTDSDAVDIDFEGFERRALLLPVSSGTFGQLAVNDENQLIYTRRSTGTGDGEPKIMLYDIDDESQAEEEVADGGIGFVISGDGAKLLVVQGLRATIQNAGAGSSSDNVKTAGMIASIDPREEWQQIFQETWRTYRDSFYVENMHGVDWNKVRERYDAMLEDCASREDLTYILRELIGELSVGHAQLGGGDGESPPRVGVGMLGCDFVMDRGAVRISRIFEGGVWDVDARGPLSQPGVDVREGDYLLAVNGRPLDTSRDPQAAFIGLAGKVTTLTVSEKPALDDAAREVVVKPMRGEGRLRFRDWIERNRAYVERMSQGRLGYIYVKDTTRAGQNDLIRQFFGQRGKEGLIIDDRWNDGGQEPIRFIELLNRPSSYHWARRYGKDQTNPPASHQGPKCMITNGLSGSGGDMFPWLFRRAGLGKIIGTRTWGGAVGFNKDWLHIDNGYFTVPDFGFYENDGTWAIEGFGVVPDIEVIDDPALMVNGGDPQLDAAIEHMLGEIETNGYHPPARPEDPDRSGMVIREEDK